MGANRARVGAEGEKALVISATRHATVRARIGVLVRQVGEQGALDQIRVVGVAALQHDPRDPEPDRGIDGHGVVGSLAGSSPFGSHEVGPFPALPALRILHLLGVTSSIYPLAWIVNGFLSQNHVD